MADTAWIIRNAVVQYTDGKTEAFSQINVYESGMLFDPSSRTAISPAGYITARST